MRAHGYEDLCYTSLHFSTSSKPLSGPMTAPPGKLTARTPVAPAADASGSTWTSDAAGHGYAQTILPPFARSEAGRQRNTGAGLLFPSKCCGRHGTQVLCFAQHEQVRGGGSSLRHKRVALIIHRR